MRIAALLPAAGGGVRLGLGPKALVRLRERTILETSAAALRAGTDELVVAAPAGREDEFRLLLPGALVVTGGSSRKETVAALLGSTDAEIVVVHDAARPFLPAAVLGRVIDAAVRTGAASAAQPLADTITSRLGNAVPPRDELLAVQTPQVFDRQLLQRAHEAPDDATDDAGLVARLGTRVDYVEGSSWLFKITTREDLDMARGLAGAWEAKSGVE